MELGKFVAGLFVLGIFMSAVMMFALGFLNNSPNVALNQTQQAQLKNFENSTGYTKGLTNAINQSLLSSLPTSQNSGLLATFTDTFYVFGGVIVVVAQEILMIPELVLNLISVILTGTPFAVGGPLETLIVSYIIGITIIILLFEIISYLGKWKENTDNIG